MTVMAQGRKASLGCLFWIAIFLLAVVLFIFNQNNIMQFIKHLQNNGTGNPTAPVVVTPAGSGTARPSPSPHEKGSPEVSLEIPSPTPSPSPASERVGKTNPSHTSSPSPAPASSPAPEKRTSRSSKLYFLVKKANGGIDLVSVTRTVFHDNAPLTETLAALLKGPTDAERRSSLISLIPAGTKLTDVYVKGDIAYISFNQEFRYNDFGVPGLQAQLKQVVFTATEFPTINKVQILIDGKKVNYLAQEGVYIGSPLSRLSF